MTISMVRILVLALCIHHAVQRGESYGPNAGGQGERGALFDPEPAPPPLIRESSDSASLRSKARVRTVEKQRPGHKSASSMSPMFGRLVVKMILRPCARTTPSATAQKQVQIDVAVGASHEQVIRVFDHECVVTAGDEFDEYLVALEHAFLWPCPAPWRYPHCGPTSLPGSRARDGFCRSRALPGE